MPQPMLMGKYGLVMGRYSNQACKQRMYDNQRAHYTKYKTRSAHHGVYRQVQVSKISSSPRSKCGNMTVNYMFQIHHQQPGKVCQSTGPLQGSQKALRSCSPASSSTVYGPTGLGVAGTVPATRTSLWARMPSSRLSKLKGDVKNCLALGVL